MPKMTDDEIKAKIADGSIFAISLDTAVFGKPEDNLLYSPVLNKLNQFSGGPIRVLFSEIVTNEIKGHIADEAERTQRQLRVALKEQKNRWKLNFDLGELPDELAISRDPKKAANKQLNNFLEAINGEIVPATVTNNVSARVLSKYFATEPPFELSEKKKNEFPDAFALLSLEEIAKQEDRFLLCVSPDKGWRNFAEQSDFLVCVTDLDLALSYFNDVESAKNVAARTVAKWKNEEFPALAEKVEQAFQLWLDNTGFSPYCSSDWIVEIEPICAVLEYVDVDTVSVPRVIAIDDHTITFIVDVLISIEFQADLVFLAKDEREYFEISSDSKEVEEKIKSHLAITVSHHIDTEPQDLEIEVVERSIDVDFGYVGPYFENEDPEHEKY